MYKYTHYEQTNYIYRQSLELDGNSETLLGPKQQDELECRKKGR